MIKVTWNLDILLDLVKTKTTGPTVDSNKILPESKIALSNLYIKNGLQP